MRDTRLRAETMARSPLSARAHAAAQNRRQCVLLGFANVSSRRCGDVRDRDFCSLVGFFPRKRSNQQRAEPTLDITKIVACGGVALAAGTQCGRFGFTCGPDRVQYTRLENETSLRIDLFGISSRPSLSPSRLLGRHVGPFHIRPGKQMKGRRTLVQEFDSGQEVVRRQPELPGQQFRPRAVVFSVRQRSERQVITDRDTGRGKGFGFVEMGSEAEAHCGHRWAQRPRARRSSPDRQRGQASRSAHHRHRWRQRPRLQRSTAVAADCETFRR